MNNNYLVWNNYKYNDMTMVCNAVVCCRVNVCVLTFEVLWWCVQCLAS